MIATTLTETQIEFLIDSLGLMDAEEVADASFETLESAQAIQQAWNECVRDLSHLSRAARGAVIHGGAPYVPHSVDGAEITLFEEVQVRKGESRRKAAIVDLGASRIVVLY